MLATPVQRFHLAKVPQSQDAVSIRSRFHDIRAEQANRSSPRSFLSRASWIQRSGSGGNKILARPGRVQALQRLGRSEAPVIRQEHLGSRDDHVGRAIVGPRLTRWKERMHKVDFPGEGIS
jgi:hypothetical protein